MTWSEFCDGLAPYINDQNEMIDFTRFHTNNDKVKLVECPPSIRNRLITYYTRYIGYKYFNGELYIKVKHHLDCSLGNTWNFM